MTMQDFRYALRGLARTKGFTVAAIVTLALGIGATTALFSVVHAVLMRSLGWHEETRLVSVRTNFEALGLNGVWISAPELRDIQQMKFFSEAGASMDLPGALQGERAERIQAGHATGSFFRALGVPALYGRIFTDAEDLKGNEGVALLSYAAFKKRYGGDPSAVGRSVTIDGIPRTIVGVLPEKFRWDEPNEFWVPLAFSPQDLQERGSRSLDAVARLAPGVSMESAQAGLKAASDDMRKRLPNWYGGNARWSLGMKPLREYFVGASREPLLLLFGAVLLVLLIACGNVANLLLARGAARAREMAVRSALGAARTRLVRQLLTESALLALFGMVLGLLLAQWSLSALLAAAPAQVRAFADASLDTTVLVFSVVLSALTTLVFGLMPAMQSSRTDLRSALGSNAVGAHGGKLRAALVVAQVGLSLVLLAFAGLFLRSFARILDVPPGFQAEHVIATRVSLSGPGYSSEEPEARYWAEAVRRASALPGVEAAGAINVAPLGGQTDWSYTIEGYVKRPGEPGTDDQFRRATAGVFHTLRIPVLQGREFEVGDDAKAPFVALVNQAWVRRYFPGQDVIGKRLRNGGDKSPWRTIVGVVGDAHDLGLDEPTPPVYYAPEAQQPDDRMTLFVRTSAPPQSLIGPLRTALAGIDATQPVDYVEPFEARIATALAPRKFPLQLLGAFALLALVLSAIGIYGVTAYGVTQRTREIGVRIAVGATEGNVTRMVLRSAMQLSLLGVAIGLVAALLSGRFLESQLALGVSPRDPLTLVGISALLAAVAVLASLLPALRAARLDPMTALRGE
jgi:predicted permease